ncbi:uncharacterized protein LOC134570966 [Pelobates fuscus]|uniref:uncharacterized protein LOC134570966 n=1 Tax=Pelobates fuscus TaxID=191477 RepID=UPI002FE4F7C0
MGRLDEQAKNRIVVLRKAGLSFRKIKKVLELDNIKVTPQAIYLFLKRKNIEPEKSTGGPHGVTPKEKPWGEGQLWNVIPENVGQCNRVKDQGNMVQKTGEMVETRRPQEIGKEEGIKIVSVTSLSKGNHTFHSPPPVQRTATLGQTLHEPRDCIVRQGHSPAINGPRQATVTVTPQPYHGRARTPLPAPRNPALLVTKKIVDRAIHLQKKVTAQNGTPLLTHGAHYPMTSMVSSRLPPMRQEPAPCSLIKDASTQTAAPIHSVAVNAEQLDTIRGELHRLTQAVQTLMDRQNRWEQEQHRQRQCNHQEIMLQIQQLGASVTARCPQNCASYNSAQEPDAQLPDIGHFKMELL